MVPVVREVSQDCSPLVPAALLRTHSEADNLLPLHTHHLCSPLQLPPEPLHHDVWTTHLGTVEQQIPPALSSQLFPSDICNAPSLLPSHWTLGDTQGHESTNYVHRRPEMGPPALQAPVLMKNASASSSDSTLRVLEGAASGSEIVPEQSQDSGDPWQRIRPKFKELYIDHALTMEQTMRELALLYGFTAS